MPVRRRYVPRLIPLRSLLIPCATGDRDFLPLSWRQVRPRAITAPFRERGEGPTRRGCQVRHSLFLQYVLVLKKSSCRKRGDRWIVAMNRWQDLTDMDVNAGLFSPSRI